MIVTDTRRLQLLSFFVALSVLGSVMASQFTQGRGTFHTSSHIPAHLFPYLVIQELGREGIFPLSGFLSSNKPFNTPFAGLFTQYIIACGLLFVTPPGDGFVFLLSRTLHPLDCLRTALTFLPQSEPTAYSSSTRLYLLVYY